MKIILSLGLIALLLSCNNNDTAVSTPIDTVRSKPMVRNNGVKIEYSDTGNGDTTLLFVHGWAINRTYWNTQAEQFRNRYRVVTVDLPGFGQSGKNRTDWSVENYGKDLNLLIDSLRLKNVVLIGHSMSGAIIVETARQNPAAIAALIGIDNFKSFGGRMDEATKKELEGIYKQMQTDFKGVIGSYAGQQLFSDSTTAPVKERVMNDFFAGDTVIAVQVTMQGDSYPLDSNLQALHKKIYLINSDSSPNDTSGFVKNNIPYRLLTIHATGHYPMIEKPAEFSRLLTQALNEISAGR